MSKAKGATARTNIIGEQYGWYLGLEELYV